MGPKEYWMDHEKRGNFTFEDLVLGTRFRHRYVIGEDVYQRFLDLFGDASPLHVDDQVAISCGFSAKLMHGAILNGFISNFVGMNFPGKRTLELGVEIHFVKPTYVYQRFLDLFGDASPLHVDDQVAISCGFSAKLMHGAILNGFISNFVGMNFPGKIAPC